MTTALTTEGESPVRKANPHIKAMMNSSRNGLRNRQCVHSGARNKAKSP